MKNNYFDLQECFGLLEIISQSKNETKVVCNDGEVCINPYNFNFTYIGKFGQMVSNLIIKNNCMNDAAKKLVILNTCMGIYSTHNGGFNILHT